MNPNQHVEIEHLVIQIPHRPGPGLRDAVARRLEQQLDDSGVAWPGEVAAAIVTDLAQRGALP